MPSKDSVINIHYKEQSRRDDLEAIGYVLIYLLKGRLPWQGLKIANSKDKIKSILDMKKSITISELTKETPG